MIRTLLAAPVLAVLASPALATPATDCRAIQDSLVRLRCYDGAMAPKPAPAPQAPVKATSFGDYPARPYSGPTRLPTFTGPTKQYATFRTRIREGMRGGPNFGGHLAVIQFGCGTGCSVVMVGDVETGAVHGFPLGGEDVQGLDLDYRRDSDLVLARFQDGERCVSARYRWTGTGFERLSRKDIGDEEACRGPS